MLFNRCKLFVVCLPMCVCVLTLVLRFSCCLSVGVCQLMCCTLLPLQVRDCLPHLKAIVQYKGKLSQKYPNVYEVTHTQHASYDIKLYLRQSNSQPHCCYCIYVARWAGNGQEGILSFVADISLPS